MAKRAFKRLNVVKETESPLKAAKYLEAGYQEITPKTENEQQAQRKKKSSKGKAMMPNAKAVESDGETTEAENPVEPEQ